MTHDADGKFALVAVALNTPAYEEKKSPLLICYFHISSISSPSSSNTGKLPTSTLSGLTKTPHLGLHSKYLSPFTVPSFFPVGSSSAIPTQGPIPGICGTGPTNATVPRRSSVEGSRRQRWPTMIPKRR